MLNRKTVRQILQAIKERKSFHEQIPRAGKIVFHKIVPYFFLYRISDKGKDRMLSDLAKSQLASVIVRYHSKEIDHWIALLALALEKEFGSCLIIEAWIDEDEQNEDISIQLSRKAALPLAEYMQKNLQIEAPDLFTNIRKQRHVPFAPQYNPIFTTKALLESNVYLLGIAVKNRYISPEDKLLPILQRHYRESLAKSLSRLFFEYIRLYTQLSPGKFKININKEITVDVLEIDKVINTESLRFDFLLLVTPTNSNEAWVEFRKSKYTKLPHFQYRPMPLDPDLVKRRLYNLPIEDIYDPTVAYLFRDKRRELDEMMSMLDDRNTEDFVHGSLQVFGNVSDKLLQIAQAMLTVIEPTEDTNRPHNKVLNAQEFAKLARQEIAFLKSQAPEMETTVRIRDDVSGVLVSRGVLHISKHYEISENRAAALIQHEVGTHIATYFNGKAQPLQLFSLGVPGYEKLQEGMAVLSEYLVDGLTNERLRILAARVIAVRHMLMGSSFLETFHLLVEQYAFSEQSAFGITMRVYRGGGLTKDALYLEGVIELIEYIRKGNDIELLTIGKIRKDYIPIIQDLIQKGFLLPPRIRPRYLQENYRDRLDVIRQQGSIFKLIK